MRAGQYLTYATQWVSTRSSISICLMYIRWIWNGLPKLSRKSLTTSPQLTNMISLVIHTHQKMTKKSAHGGYKTLPDSSHPTPLGSLDIRDHHHWRSLYAWNAKNAHHILYTAGIKNRDPGQTQCECIDINKCWPKELLQIGYYDNEYFTDAKWLEALTLNNQLVFCESTGYQHPPPPHPSPPPLQLLCDKCDNCTTLEIYVTSPFGLPN